jgi:hypothetical protein
LPTLFEPLLLEFLDEPRVIDDWWVIGTDGSCELQVDATDGKVRAFDPLHKLPTRFVNSTVNQLGAFIAAYERYCRGGNVSQLRNSLGEIDPAALSHPECWWSVVLEQVEDGLL